MARSPRRSPNRSLLWLLAMLAGSIRVWLQPAPAVVVPRPARLNTPQPKGLR